MGYPCTFAPLLYAGWNKAVDHEWQVVVNNTFLDIAFDEEDGPSLLTRNRSAPGRLVSCRQVSSGSSAQPAEFIATSHKAFPTRSDSAYSLHSESTDLPQSPKADIEAEKEENIDACSDPSLAEAEDREVTSQDVAKVSLSKTARRNQRTRALNKAALGGGLIASLVPSDAAASREEAVGTQSASPKKRKSSKKNAKTVEEPPGDESRRNVKEATEQEEWRGTNPTELEREALKAALLDMFRQERRLPRDFNLDKSSTVMTLEELAKFNCDSGRPMVSIHGDVFDVSSDLANYGPAGVRSFEAGTDLTWAVVTGSHSEEMCNCFFDMFKARDQNMVAGRFMSLCSSAVSFRRDYGKPVGRLNIFLDERSLPAPPTPHMEEVGECTVQ